MSLPNTTQNAFFLDDRIGTECNNQSQYDLEIPRYHFSPIKKMKCYIHLKSHVRGEH